MKAQILYVIKKKFFFGEENKENAESHEQRDCALLSSGEMDKAHETKRRSTVLLIEAGKFIGRIIRLIFFYTFMFSIAMVMIAIWINGDTFADVLSDLPFLLLIAFISAVTAVVFFGARELPKYYD